MLFTLTKVSERIWIIWLLKIVRRAVIFPFGRVHWSSRLWWWFFKVFHFCWALGFWGGWFSFCLWVIFSFWLPRGFCQPLAHKPEFQWQIYQSCWSICCWWGIIRACREECQHWIYQQWNSLYMQSRNLRFSRGSPIGRCWLAWDLCAGYYFWLNIYILRLFVLLFGWLVILQLSCVAWGRCWDLHQHSARWRCSKTIRSCRRHNIGRCWDDLNFDELRSHSQPVWD